MRAKPLPATRRDFLRWTTASVIAALLCGGPNPPQPSRPNILFVIVDDLRPELGCYGNTVIKTPNFDRFAQEATTFTRAFCQAAACSPSRASVMLGQRPDTTHVWSLGEEFRKIHPNAVTMPQHFHRFGYYTVSIGKIFHNHMPDRVSFDEPDLRPPEYMSPELIDRDPESFYYDEGLKEELATVRAERLRKNPNAYARGWAYGRSWEASEAPDDAFYDGAQTTLALQKLKTLQEGHQPFYLALGYYRPHLPFVAPKKYWDLYDRNALPLAPNPYLPKGSPPMAMDSAYELTGCYDLEWVKHPAVERVPEQTARLLKHGYYASVSYVDACFGRLMEGLKDLGLARNTIVVVWGDHGWKLGEHGSWCKQTNYNIDTRAPLLIRVPGQSAAPAQSEQLVELVDLYPTLCELADIPVPADMEGMSLAPLLKDPQVALKSAVFSQYRERPRVTLDGKDYMGYSMVTSRYHYVQWHTWDNDRQVAGEQVAVELYDNEVDPQENTNLAGLPEYADLVERLARQARAGWRAARVKKDR